MNAQKIRKSIIENFEPRRENLLPILHAVNDSRGYIGEAVMQEIADYLDISATEVYGTTTFYSFFNLEPKGKFIIRLCRSISCELGNKSSIARTLEKELKIKFGETTRDKFFTLEYTNCIGMCDKGPAMLVNKKVYTQLTPAKAKKIITDLKKGGQK